MSEEQIHNPLIEDNFETSGADAGRMKNTELARELAEIHNQLVDKELAPEQINNDIEGATRRLLAEAAARDVLSNYDKLPRHQQGGVNERLDDIPETKNLPEILSSQELKEIVQKAPAQAHTWLSASDDYRRLQNEGRTTDGTGNAFNTLLSKDRKARQLGVPLMIENDLSKALAQQGVSELVTFESLPGGKIGGEAAVVIHYRTVRQQPYEYLTPAPNRRPGNVLNTDLVVPESAAKKMAQAFEEDPQLIREMVEQIMKESIGLSGEKWVGESGLDSGTRPPYEKWAEKNGGVNRIRIQSLGGNVGGDARNLEF